MNLQFIKKLHGPEAAAAAGAAASVNPVGLAITGAQAAMGIIQTISGKSKMNKLMGQRKAYSTPQEYYDMLQATQSMAQQGYDAFTLNYLTGQAERGMGAALGDATRLGANPNDLGALYDRFEQGIMKIGAENHALNMENFSKYLSAKDIIGQNKAAEWKSQQDIIKDKMQAAGAEMQAGVQNIGSAANAGISLSASKGVSDLYKNDAFKQIADALKLLKRKGGANSGADSTSTSSGVGYAPDFDNYNQPGSNG